MNPFYIAASAIIAVFTASTFEAQAQGSDPIPGLYTSFVSGLGSGTMCSRSQPCATFQAAFLQTITGGTIVCLDSADFAGARITRAVTIDCSGSGSTFGVQIVPISGNGCPCASIIVDIPTSQFYRDVKFRGVGFNYAQGGVVYGLYIKSASAVYVENTAFNVPAGAIFDARTGGQSRLYVTNVVIRNSDAPGIVAGAQGTSAVVLDNVSLLNNKYGIATATGNNVVITRSTISGNSIAGISADGGSQINLLNSVMSHNTAHVNNYGAVRLQENTLQFSNVALKGNASISLGANRFVSNGSIGTTPTLATGAPADVFN